MGEPAENPSEPQPKTENLNPVLDYRTPEIYSAAAARKFDSNHVLVPFAFGIILPFLALLILSEGDSEVCCFGFSATWGLCAILLIAIKLRSYFVQLDPVGRPWWVHTIAGCADFFAFYFVLVNTTGRERFWPLLGQGGSVLVAFCLLAVIAALLAIVLTPKPPKEQSLPTEV